jgi:hypothetical protein
MNAFMNPSVAVLAKLASIAVHTDEALSPDGHDFDRAALRGLLDDDEVQTFLAAGRKLAMIPERR